MQNQIGFRRNIYRTWLDAAAALCVETRDSAELRVRLDPIVADHVESVENRRTTIGILLHIWHNSTSRSSALHEEAQHLFAQSQTATDRLWLHYGLTLLAYDFFRINSVIIGQLTRYNNGVTPKQMKQRLIAEIGQRGGLDKAVDRIVSSLRDWGIFIDAGERYTYGPPIPRLQTNNHAIELWLLRAALTAHPAEEISFADLIRLPELFPFRFTVTVDDLRTSPTFEVQRQGISWDMVRLTDEPQKLQPISQMPMI